MTIDRVCAEALDLRDLRLALLDELRRIVPFDAFAWLMTDPATEVGVAPIADVPCLDELPRLIRLKYCTSVNRWTIPGPAVRRLWDATGGVPEDSPLWRELLAGLGVRDVASIVFRDRFGCWSFLDLWRTGGLFTDAEADRLAAIEPVVTTALRAGVRRSLGAASGADDSRSGPVVMVLAPDLHVTGQTAETEAYLRALVPPEDGRPPIPAAAYNVGAQLLAVEAGVDDHPATARVHLGGASWSTLRAARIGANVAVTIEAATRAERLDLLARSSGLTVRETELLTILAGGADTRAIASQMFVSEHTVQDHLKAIFAKTGARSRRELLAAAGGP